MCLDALNPNIMKRIGRLEREAQVFGEPEGFLSGVHDSALCKGTGLR